MSDLRATQVLAAGAWTGEPADCVVLDFDERYRRRVTMTGVQGLEFLLDLPEPVMLRGGDALRLGDGRLVEVVAAPEELVEVRGRGGVDLVRLAWHIGNRHLPAQITATALRLRRDHVIEEMLRGLGARLVFIEAPFDPEGGAYAGNGHQGGGHDRHDTGHHHDHGRHGEGHHAHDHAHHDHGHHDHGHHDHGHDHAGHDHHGAPGHRHDPHGHRHG